jgi:CDP-glucose 4,6-dehydratase
MPPGRYGATISPKDIERGSQREILLMDATFWNRKKVLITGHTGFKGSWLSVWLQMLGADIVGYALPPPTQPSLFETARIADGMTSIMGDVRDLEHLKSIIKTHNPEVVIHMAAQSLVRHGYCDPVATYATNVMGTVNLLEGVRGSESVRLVVVITSDKCYENREWLWGYREDDPLGGGDPYSSSKGCAELVISAYRRSFFSSDTHCNHRIVLASARAGNVIGGGDWARDRLIPDIMAAFMERKPVAIRNPDAIRPWQHVLQPLSGYLCLAERLWFKGPELAQAWNFGPDPEDAKPVSWIVDHLSHLWGDGARWELDHSEHPPESTQLRLDSSKARSLLGWTPKLSLLTSLELVVEWYQGYRQDRDMRLLTERQIRWFEDLQLL